MRTRILAKSVLFASVLLLVAGVAGANPVTPMSANGGVGVFANLVQPIAVNGTADMNFGGIVPSDVYDGWVRLNTDGTRMADGNSQLGSSAGVSPATFVVTGDTSATFSLTIPDSIQLLAADNSGYIPIVELTADHTGAIPIAVGGTTIKVGGRLILNASRPKVHYSGGLTITATYN